MTANVALAVIGLLIGTGCVTSVARVEPDLAPGREGTTGTNVEGLSAAVRLQRDFTDLFEAPQFDHTLWSVVVRSLDRQEDLYRLNPAKLVMPA